MIYIDSNVFIFAALNNEELENSAKLILEKVENQSIEASARSLTFDEVVWIVRKNRSFEDAVSIGQLPTAKAVSLQLGCHNGQ